MTFFQNSLYLMSVDVYTLVQEFDIAFFFNVGHFDISSVIGCRRNVSIGRTNEITRIVRKI